MPTDKIIPRVLNISTEERLHQEGDMLDALNVTISENGEGSEGILKNVRGTTRVPVPEQYNINENSVVVGSVDDPENNRIYVFVENGSKPDGIYYYDGYSGQLNVLVERQILSFNNTRPVKADVIHTFLSGDSERDTLLYFTDNDNPPRKINVTRIISEGVSAVYNTNEPYDVCKGYNLLPPTFSFTTDSEVQSNNFHNDFFQFATQYIYEDGEVSAISPYSKIAYPDHISLMGTENYGYGSLYKNDNLCLIDCKFSLTPAGQTNINPNPYLSDYKPTVKKIRLLARIGNSPSFYEIDEFSVDEDLYREVYGVEKKIYNKETSQYSFYNDVLYNIVPDREVNKLYDNVPLRAEGQAIQGERLIYSNYQEGYPNHKIDGVTIDVQYNETSEFGETSATVTESVNSIVIDLDDSQFFTDGILPANSNVQLNFTYKPTVGSTISNSPILQASYVLPDTSAYIVIDISELFVYGDGVGAFVSVSVNNDSPLTYAQFAEELTTALAGYTSNYTFTNTEDQTAVVNESSDIFSGYPEDSSILFNSNAVSAVVSFEDVSFDDTTKEITISPEFISIDISNSTLVNLGVEFFSQSQYFDGYTQDISNNFVIDDSITSRTFSSYRTFKAGSAHSLGIVYYDERGRSSFVNKLGDFYVAPFDDDERDDGTGTGNKLNGPSAIKVAFPATTTKPSWAEAYQLVYSGPTSWDEHFSYSVADAFPKYAHTTTQGDHDAVTSSKQIYVSLKTLDLYREDKGALRNYSYQEGDLLRVISYVDSDDNVVFPRSSEDNLIEFRVVSYDFYGAEEESPVANFSHSDPGALGEERKGHFIGLEAPNTISGQDAYNGFDWYSVYETKTSISATHPYASTDTAYTVDNSLWGNKVVVEVLRPTRTKETNLYYEIGEARKFITPDSSLSPKYSAYGLPFYTSEGSAYFRPIACKVPYDSSGSKALTAPQDWVYEERYLESDSITDFVESKMWSKGRPHTVYESAGTFVRFNGLTYSDRYAEDSQVLTLSAFNQPAFNWQSLEASRGEVRYIGRFADNLVAIQERGVSRIPINANTVAYADGGSNMTVSENFMGRPVYFSGNYGCADNPESVVSLSSGILFADRFNKKVFMLDGNGLVAISDLGVDSKIQDMLTYTAIAIAPVIRGGYDPDTDTYLLTAQGQTIGFDIKNKRWRSMYSFLPDDYQHLGDSLFSFKSFLQDDQDNEDPNDDIYTVMHFHNPNGTYCNFYGVQYASSVTVVSKFDPSMVKAFGALSVETNNQNWSASITTPGGQNTGNFNNWRVRERTLHHEIPRDATTAVPNIYIGVASSVSDGEITFDFPVSGLYIPLGSEVFLDGEDTGLTFQGFTGSRVMSVSGDLSGTGDISLAPADSGNVIRDYFCNIRLNNSSTTKYELFAINTHFDVSHLGTEINRK